MPKEYDNEMRGVLFENDKKGNEKAPDMKGDAQIKGERVQIAGWKRVSKSGRRYMQLVFEEPQQGARPPKDNSGGW